MKYLVALFVVLVLVLVVMPAPAGAMGYPVGYPSEPQGYYGLAIRPGGVITAQNVPAEWIEFPPQPVVYLVVVKPDGTLSGAVGSYNVEIANFHRERLARQTGLGDRLVLVPGYRPGHWESLVKYIP